MRSAFASKQNVVKQQRNKKVSTFVRKDPIYVCQLFYLTLLNKALEIAKLAFVQNRLHTAISTLVQLIPLCQEAMDMSNLLQLNACIA